MDDLNSDPEFDKILAEMLPNSGENIVPFACASSAIARSPHSSAVSNVFSCNYQWNAGFQTFPEPVITDQNAQITTNYNIIQLLVFKGTNIRIYWCAKGDIDRCKAEASITFRTPINLDIGLFKHQWLFYYFSLKLKKLTLFQRKFQCRDFKSEIIVH